jgi:hypothetical protein
MPFQLEVSAIRIERLRRAQVGVRALPRPCNRPLLRPNPKPKAAIISTLFKKVG